MVKHFISPNKYVQGTGVLNELGKYAAPYGKKPLVLISEASYPRVKAVVEASFKKAGHEPVIEVSDGACRKKDIQQVAENMAQQGCDSVAGIGGGKILDLAKVVAFRNSAPVIVCPTSASSGMACSALSIAYDDNGVFDEYLVLPANPDMVLADTTVIAQSSVRLTVAGMGAALPSYFEARACRSSRAVVYSGGTVTYTALTLAKLCMDTLFEDGLKAKLALEAGAITDSVKKIVEANILLGGLSAESGGMAAAHAYQDGLTVLEECRQTYYGERVAFGTLAQLALEGGNRSELEQTLRFCTQVGLPVTLAQLGVASDVADKVHAVAEAACAEKDTMCNMPVPVTVENAAAALLAADSYGRWYQEHQCI